ncbi:IS21 family transposase [Pygmaiobacter massiliensis]|uniref:IS21 family transposase n=1 Tax=Pygmaiobacter massiliensis TaxID=1917873 RepID=UPI00289E64BA|nr:IS21 family transposase [Pygmaiobacter massiliensis]
MTNCLEILRLKQLGYSQRTIESMLHCSRHAVRQVLEEAIKQGIHWPLDEDVTNTDLEQLLFPDKHTDVSMYVEPDYQYIHRELAKTGVTLTLLWKEYCHKCYEAGKMPYMSTQFGDKYRKWARVTKATMRIQHKPGDAIQVDWAGDTIPVFDSITGEQSAAYLFVAVLPCSYYAYAEACDDMKTENWLNCHVHAFDYLGGVARLLIPDNCKTATASNTRYETVVDRSYQELAEYYGIAIVPARVRRPQDKSSAEASVRFAETWIIASLRDRKFFSLHEVNEAVAEKLAELNNREFKQRAGTRHSAYLEEEQPYMLPLPAAPFEAAVWSVAKVPNDYLITDGRNKYSVPYNLIGEKVDIRVTKNTVEVYFHGSRVASHRRL